MIKEFINIVESMEGITDDWFKKGSFETHKHPTPIKYKTAIEKFIEQVENHNSVTPLGTLEYLDSFSKLYTTNTLCAKEGDTNFSDSSSSAVFSSILSQKLAID